MQADPGFQTANTPIEDGSVARDVSPVIEARGVHVSLEGAPVLHGIDARVGAGSLVGLVGPNGSGKTTLLRATAGLVPFEGYINLFERSIESWKPRELAKRLAFVRQSVSLSFDFRVSELVLLGRSPHLRLMREYAQEDFNRMRGALERVDLGGFENRSVLSLSGGELQRVFLAQALVQEADVFLLDEPTAHLDVHYQFEFMDLVRMIVERGRTAVVVFHDLALASRYADQIIALHRGRVVAAGGPREVITSGLLAEVFRMKAEVTRAPAGGLNIQYNRPIHTLQTSE